LTILIYSDFKRLSPLYTKWCSAAQGHDVRFALSERHWWSMTYVTI